MKTSAKLSVMFVIMAIVMAVQTRVARAMRLSCAVSVLVSVVTAAVLLVLVPAATAVTYNGSGTYSYPPNTTTADEGLDAYDTTTVNVLTGGLLDGDVEFYGNSTVNVSGGTIQGNMNLCEYATAAFLRMNWSPLTTAR